MLDAHLPTYTKKLRLIPIPNFQVEVGLSSLIPTTNFQVEVGLASLIPITNFQVEVGLPTRLGSQSVDYLHCRKCCRDLLLIAVVFSVDLCARTAKLLHRTQRNIEDEMKVQAILART